MQIKTLFSKHEIIISFLLWIFIFFLLLIFTFQKWGCPVVDCGRDAYVAERIIKGDLLYLDVYYTYGPLAPYALALSYLLFGINLNALYLTGIICSLIILIYTYKLSNILFRPILSAFINVSIILVFCFNQGIFNYIFPYTYSMLFATLFTVVFVYYLYKHLETDDFKYLIIASIAVGIGSLTKIEYTIYLITAFLLYILILKFYLKRLSTHLITLSFLPILIIGSITTVFFLSQGQLQEFVEFIEYNQISLQSKPSIYISNYILNSGHSRSILLQYALWLIPILFFCNLFIISFTRIKNIFIKYFITIIMAYITVLFIKSHSLDLIMIKNFLFSFIPIIFSLGLIYYLAKAFFYKITLSNKDLLLFFICFITVLLCLRSYIHLNIFFYGIFSAILCFIPITYFILKTPDLIEKKYSFLKKYRTNWYTSAIVIYLILITGHYSSYNLNNTAINQPKGRILTSNIIAAPINELVDYIKNHTKKDDEIVLCPEETLIYFLSDRKSATKFYDYLPIRLVTPELEDYLISIIKEKNIKLIVISSRIAPFYNKSNYGVDYNQSVYNWISSNYKLCKTIGTYKENTYFADAYGFKVYQKECN